MIKKWKTIEKKLAGDYKIFDAYWIERELEKPAKKSKFVVLNSPRWVNIIPITKNMEVVLIRQYRHGIDEITLEIPGGLVEENESPAKAAERECLEETGYRGESDAIFLGENYPNPAFLNNVCYSYLWKNCEKITAQSLDKNEDIDIQIVPLDKAKNLILNGEIKHSLVLTAFFYYFLRYSNL